MARKDKETTLLSEEREVQLLAALHRVPIADLSGFGLDRELVQSFPPDFLYRANFIPFSRDGETVHIAMADPSDIEAIDAVESFLGRKVQVFVASRRAIHEAR